MSRPIRIEVEDGWYHVINRGIGRREIFRDDSDRTDFLERLFGLRESQAAYDAVPEELRSPFHGKCAEGRCLSKALDAGVDPAGGTSVATQIGRLNHGVRKPACSSCGEVLKKFGVTDGTK